MHHVSPINFLEPSTSTESNSEVTCHNFQGAHAEPVASTSSECHTEVGFHNTQSIDQLNVEPMEANLKSTPTHKYISDVGCQINTRGVQLMMKS